MNLASFHADGRHANHLPLAIQHQVKGKPFIQEDTTCLQVALIERMQKGMASSVCGSAGAGSLATLAIVLGLTTKGALIDAAIFLAGKWQAHVLKFKHSLGANGTHVFNGILVANVVRTLDGIEHVPAPVVIGIFRGNGTGDATLGRNCVGASGEDL